MTAPTPAVDINRRIQQFIELRDKIKELDQAHKDRMAPYREALDTLSGILLNHLKNINADSVAAADGTVYRTVKHSATIADGKVFWDFVLSNGAWDLIDKKANVTAVGDFIEEHAVPPPGVNFSSVMTVGVRRK